MAESNARRYAQSLPVLPADGGPPLGPPDAAGGGPSRREFLQAAGFTFAAAFLGGCQRAPVEEAVLPLSQPEDIVLGKASYYASTCGACGSGCGVLAKSYDGRPIKLEGNPEHPVSKGGLCAAGQASLLGLYDRFRCLDPLKDGQEASWEEVDRDIRAQLDLVRRRGGAVRVLTGTITSPTTRALLTRFLAGFPDARQVVYDPVSSSAVLDAHERTHGVRVLPRYHLEKADVIAGFDADFLGTWISPVEFTGGYRAGRPLTGNPPRSSYHVQVESRLSLTGSKADERVCLAPDETNAAITCLAFALAKQAGTRPGGAEHKATGDALPPGVSSFCDRLATRLWEARGRSLVLCGSQDVRAQLACNFINHLLGNYGSTLDVERPSLQRQGNDRNLEALLGEVQARKVAALFFLDSNPVYDLPNGEALARAVQQVPLVVCCTERLDETAQIVLQKVAGAARYVCPHPHYLESWGDVEPVSGILGLRQPTIPLFGNTRPVNESLAAWAGKAKPGYDLLREHWQAHVFPRQPKERNFQAFWDRAVHDGYAEVTPTRVQAKPFDVAAVRSAFQVDRLPQFTATTPGAKPGRGTTGPGEESLALLLYPKVGIPDASHAYNPWLQELPDPISKVAWDNYACLAPATAARLGLGEADVVRLEVPGPDGPARALELPVFIQPGQHERVVAVALGYGSLASARFAKIGPQWLEARPTLGDNGLVGQNASPLLAWDAGTLRYVRAGVTLTRTGARHVLAATQSHHQLTVPSHMALPGQERRPAVQETTLAALAGAASHPKPAETKGDEAHADLWPDDHPYGDRRWGMVIDLNACTGCSACVIACQAENNIPVVGKDEVRRQREMHWIRIDRYYAEPASSSAAPGASGGVEVAYQPMLCHHCDRAPCETVCPVLATVHSADGLNEQVYNRCVGTRYCANNCPYKVRRFNWFAYAHEDTLQNLALNPDVTVRSRGVMEKCTFCAQRLQEAGAEARLRGEPLRDGDVQTACQQACPARAIVFGNLKDGASQVARLRSDPRHYQVLAELNIGPAVGYLKVVRNGEEGQRHG